MNVKAEIVKVSLAVIVHQIPDFTPEPYTQGDAGAFGGNQSNYRGLTSGRGPGGGQSSGAETACRAGAAGSDEAFRSPAGKRHRISHRAGSRRGHRAERCARVVASRRAQDRRGRVGPGGHRQPQWHLCRHGADPAGRHPDQLRGADRQSRRRSGAQVRAAASPGTAARLRACPHARAGTRPRPRGYLAAWSGNRSRNRKPRSSRACRASTGGPPRACRCPRRSCGSAARPDNDIVVSDLGVSKRARRAAGSRRPAATRSSTWAATTAPSSMAPGSTSAELGDYDIIAIGHATFRLAGGELIEYVDEGNVTFEAHELRVQVSDGGKPKVLLTGHHLPVAPSVPCWRSSARPGAGKSTLLNALTGKRPADQGSVLLRLPRPVRELRRAAAPHRAGAAESPSRTTSSPRGRRSATRPSCASRPDTGAAERRRRVERGARRAGDDASTRDTRDRAAVRRPEEAGQHRPRAAHQAAACCSSTSRPRRSTRTSSASSWSGCAGWPTGTAEKGQSVVVITHDVEPKLLDLCDRLIVLAARRQDGLLRTAQGGAEVLRQGRLGGRLPGVLRRAPAGLDGRVQGVEGLRAVRDGADDRARAAAAAARRAAAGGTAAAASARPHQPAVHAVPPLRAGDVRRPRLHALHHPAPADPRRGRPGDTVARTAWAACRRPTRTRSRCC